MSFDSLHIEFPRSFKIRMLILQWPYLSVDSGLFLLCLYLTILRLTNFYQLRSRASGDSDLWTNSSDVAESWIFQTVNYYFSLQNFFEFFFFYERFCFFSWTTVILVITNFCFMLYAFSKNVQNCLTKNQNFIIHAFICKRYLSHLNSLMVCLTRSTINSR